MLVVRFSGWLFWPVAGRRLQSVAGRLWFLAVRTRCRPRCTAVRYITKRFTDTQWSTEPTNMYNNYIRLKGQSGGCKSRMLFSEVICRVLRWWMVTQASRMAGMSDDENVKQQLLWQPESEAGQECVEGVCFLCFISFSLILAKREDAWQSGQTGVFFWRQRNKITKQQKIP